MNAVYSEQFRRKKNGYRRSAVLTRQQALRTGCPGMWYLRRQDVQRALHYRTLERQAKQIGI